MVLCYRPLPPKMGINGNTEKCTKVQNPRRKKTCLVNAEQTDSHMLSCFAGGVSTLSLELSETEQLCILATVANYTSSRRYAQARKHDAWSNNAHAHFPRSKNGRLKIAVQCRKCWISATERFQRKLHKFSRCPLSV